MLFTVQLLATLVGKELLSQKSAVIEVVERVTCPDVTRTVDSRPTPCAGCTDNRHYAICTRLTFSVLLYQSKSSL